MGGEGSREGLMFVLGLQRQVEVADVYGRTVFGVSGKQPQVAGAQGPEGEGVR